MKKIVTSFTLDRVDLDTMDNIVCDMKLLTGLSLSRSALLRYAIRLVDAQIEMECEQGKRDTIISIRDLAQDGN